VRRALLVILLTLSACGFAPVYSDATPAAFAAVEVSTIPNESGIYLRNAVVDRLHAHGAGEPRWTLMLSPVAESVADLDITKSAEATRAQFRASTTLRLTDADGRVVLTRELRAITSYNILASEFTNRVSRDAARRWALEELARQAEQALALYFSGQANEA
jgi:LPS-assembly lipoprotein